MSFRNSIMQCHSNYNRANANTPSRFRAWRFMPVLAFCVSAAAESPPITQEDDGRLNELAECAAYFFIAARADAVTEFETHFQTGEFAFNLLIASVGQDEARVRYDEGHNRVVQKMDGQWAKFEQTRDHYRQRCGRLAEAARDASNPD